MIMVVHNFIMVFTANHGVHCCLWCLQLVTVSTVKGALQLMMGFLANRGVASLSQYSQLNHSNHSLS